MSRPAPASAEKSQLFALADFAHQLADVAAQHTLPHFRQLSGVANKQAGGASGFDPVTVADRAAEAAMVDAIRATYPDHKIIGEEYGTQGGASEFAWVLDPIDGTRAYICGAPTWGTLIGLKLGATAIVGLMDQPFTRERFFAVQSPVNGTASTGATPQADGGAFFARDGGAPVRLATSPRTRLEDAYLTTTSPDLFAPGAEREGYLRVQRSVRTARYGLDCYGYCLLAHGTLDLVIEAGLNAYDIVALIPIIEAAGGVVTTWQGGPATDGGQIVAAANAELHARALEKLQG